MLQNLLMPPERNGGKLVVTFPVTTICHHLDEGHQSLNPLGNLWRKAH